MRVRKEVDIAVAGNLPARAEIATAGSQRTGAEPTSAAPIYQRPSYWVAKRSAVGVAAVPRAWSTPVSDATFTIGFTQFIGANDALRPGSDSKTPAFTSSTTTP
jgi:hypothetical protein